MREATQDGESPGDVRQESLASTSKGVDGTPLGLATPKTPPVSEPRVRFRGH